MSIPLTVAIVLVSGQNDVPFTGAISKATRETLGANAQVVLHDVPAGPTDDEALAIERSDHADAIAVVVWLDAQKSRASLRVHVESPPHWIDRELGFGSGDAPTEEARTLGFAVASMMPEEDVSARPDDTNGPPAATPSPPIAFGRTDAGGPFDPSRVSQGSVVPSSVSSLAASPERAPIGSIGAVASAAISFGGEGGGVGGNLDGRYFLGRHFAVRAAFSLRTGDVDKADARLLTARIGGGLAWRSGEGSRAHPITFGARADLLGAYLHVTRTIDGASESESRWLPAAEVLVEGAWAFSDAASLVVGVGPETLFGSTDVVVQGTRVTEIAPLTLVFELGLHARF